MGNHAVRGAVSTQLLIYFMSHRLLICEYSIRKYLYVLLFYWILQICYGEQVVRSISKSSHQYHHPQKLVCLILSLVIILISSIKRLITKTTRMWFGWTPIIVQMQINLWFITIRDSELSFSSYVHLLKLKRKDTSIHLDVR